MATTTSHADLLYPDLNELFTDSHMEYEPEWPHAFKVRTMDRTPLRDLKLAGIGTLRRIRENDGVQYVDPIMGLDRWYAVENFGLGIQISEFLMEDELYGVFADMTRELARAARYIYEFRSFDLLNKGFDPDGSIGFDNQPLFSVNHQFQSRNFGALGPVQANTFPAGITADLGQATYSAAIIQFRRWTDAIGLPVKLRPQLLLYSHELEPLVIQVVDSEYDPFSNVNAVSPPNVLGRGVQRFACTYLVNRKSWFLRAGRDDCDTKVYIRRRTTFDKADDPRTGAALFRCTTRFTVGHGEWYGWFGSRGV